MTRGTGRWASSGESPLEPVPCGVKGKWGDSPTPRCWEMDTLCAGGVRADRAQRAAGAQEMGSGKPPHWGSPGHTAAGFGERETPRGSGASNSTTSDAAGAVGRGHGPWAAACLGSHPAQSW